MSSIIKANEIQNSSGGADVKIQTLKHPNSSSNNLVLGSDGTTTVSGALTASGGIANAGTISAGTIGTGVTINAGSNVSGIGQLVGISWKTATGTGTTVTVEGDKTYIGLYTGWNGTHNYSSPYEIYRFTVTGGGTVTQDRKRDWDTAMVCNFGPYTISAHTSSTYTYFTLIIFEEGKTVDMS